MTRDDLIRRGDAAVRLLGDPLFAAALEEIQRECTETWAASNPAEVAGREDAYRLQRCIGLLRQKLEAWAASGTLEKGNAARRLVEARAGA